MFFDGHGSPFWPGEFETLIKNAGLATYQMFVFHNNNRLPICIVGGFHNNLLNVSDLTTVFDLRNKHSMWSYGDPVTGYCGWHLSIKTKGGSIATLGYTGLRYEAGGEIGDLDGDLVNEPDCVEALCGYLKTQLFKGYGLGNIDILGKTWCTAINSYLSVYPGMENFYDVKTLEQWVTLGDPTLRIGGYVSQWLCFGHIVHFVQF